MPEEYVDLKDPIRDAPNVPDAIAWILRLGVSPDEVAIAWPNGSVLLGVLSPKTHYMLSEESQEFAMKAFIASPNKRLNEIQRKLEALGLPEQYLVRRPLKDVARSVRDQYTRARFANYFRVVGVPSGVNAMISTKQVIEYYGYPSVQVDENTPEGAKFHDLCKQRDEILKGLQKLQSEARKFFCLNLSTEWEKLWPTWQMCCIEHYLVEAPSFCYDSFLLELKNDTRYHQSESVNAAVAAFLRHYCTQNAAR